MNRLFSLFMALLLLAGSIPVQATAASSAPLTGNGTESDPFIILTVEQLQGAGLQLDAHYKLGADIDASATAGWNDGQGFVPIGDSDDPFTGSFDGAGYEIRQLTINRPSGVLIGLFGMISGGSVRNVKLVEGSVNGGHSTGMLAGLSSQDSRIENTSATGRVSGDSQTGGLIGEVGSGSEVFRSHAAVSVNGHSKVGGLVGENWGRIDRSYATGDVNGSEEVGGFAGRSDTNARISNTYAVGSVTGNSQVGGLVGRNVGRISQTYAAGSVTGTGTGVQDVGGLVGRAFPNMSIEEASFHVDGGNNTAALKKRATYPSEWNFGSIWTIEEGRTYPTLQGIAANIGLDLAPPTIVSAIRPPEHPDRVVVTFDEEVKAADAGGFTILADGNPVAVTAISGTGTRTLILNLSQELERGQKVTLSYDRGSGNIVDLANNPMYRVVERFVNFPLEVTMTKADESPYEDGAWTNVSVTASVYASANEEFKSLVYSIDGGPAQPYDGPIVISDEGTHSLLFQATDNADNLLEAHRAIKIDRTPPTVEFSPNGNELGSSSVASTVVVDDPVSGVDPASLQYAWSEEQSLPTEGWAAFSNGAALTYRGANGYRYLHVRAADQAGNPTSVASERFRIHAPSTGSSGGGGGALPDNVHWVGADGATVRFEGGRVVIPAGAFDRPFYLTVNEIAGGEGLPLADGERLASKAFSFVKDQPGDLLKPIAVVLSTGGGSADEDARLYWLDEETGAWTTLNDPSSDKEKGELGGTLDRLAVVAVIAKPKAPPEQPQENSGSEVRFTDLKGHWAEEFVIGLAGKGAVKGLPDGSFQPDRSISRAEFASILVRALGLSEDEAAPPFADTAGHWAEAAIAAAYARGIVQGYSADTFAPDEPVTREQIATIVAKALKLQASQPLPPFADREAISAWAVSAVAAAAEHGIVSGLPGNRMGPQAHATRAEAAAVIWRALEIK
ncbi:S-layer homology domain-containing protein [Paenibacillaceae bacterium WGS1546]|uniref:S-layer homology domain-containing protein n=1 Tax=Cohnella sp. WGS1546 TaxID=3366810 RepID=UPI00372D16D7